MSEAPPATYVSGHRFSALSLGVGAEVGLSPGRHRNRGKLSDLVAEHLDHLHYLNDILIINCEFLNDVLTDHLLNRLFLPLYVYSLENQDKVSPAGGVCRRGEQPPHGDGALQGPRLEPEGQSFPSLLS